MSEENISKSKQKRLAQKQAREKQKKAALLRNVLTVLIPAALVVAIVVAALIYRDNQLDYSRYLNADGTIAEGKASDYVTVNTDAMSFSRSELTPSDEMIQSDIDSMLSSYASVSTDAALESASGNKVDIYYTATLPDGTIYSAATPENGSATFTIGDAQVTEAFDEALTGHHAGDSFSTQVTYPDDYSDTNLAGQTLDYAVSFNGIVVEPEFDDAFVQEYFADKASTAEEYRQSMIDEYYQDNLRNAISASISENSTVKAHPAKYEKNLAKVLADQDLKTMESYNQMYMQYMGSPMYTNAYEMYGFTTQEEYEEDLKQRASKGVEDALELQYIYEQSGLTNTPEEVKQHYADQNYNYDEMEAVYGAGYLAQGVLSEKALDYLCEHVTITD